MNFWIIVYLVSLGVASLLLIAAAWSELRTNPQFSITLKDLFVGIILTVCPLVNTMTALALMIYFVTEVSGSIVVFGKKT